MTIKIENAQKKMRCPVLWDNAKKITGYYFGDKNDHGEAIWYDADGNAYTMIYARRARQYSFNPETKYNK